MPLFIVRHAETVGNAARIIQSPEAPLSDFGKSQAERLARRMQQSAITHIISSDFLRAMQTAEAVSRLTGVGIEMEPTLRERDFGDLRGLSYDSLPMNPFDPSYSPPNGEDRPTFLRRVALGWERVSSLAARMPGNLLVVTHGQVCRALVQQHTQLAPGASLPPTWMNTSVTAVDVGPPWRAQLVNCVAHLR